MRTDALDYYIDRGLETVFVYDILFFWHGFEATVASSGFRFYDQPLEKLIRDLLRYWGTAIELGSNLYSPNGLGGYSLKPEQYWGSKDQKNLDAMMNALAEAKKSLKALLDYVHDHYPEVDLLETNRATYDSVKQYMERNHPPTVPPRTTTATKEYPSGK